MSLGFSSKAIFSEELRLPRVEVKSCLADATAVISEEHSVQGSFYVLTGARDNFSNGLSAALLC